LRSQAQPWPSHSVVVAREPGVGQFGGLDAPHMGERVEPLGTASTRRGCGYGWPMGQPGRATRMRCQGWHSRIHSLPEFRNEQKGQIIKRIFIAATAIAFAPLTGLVAPVASASPPCDNEFTIGSPSWSVCQQNLVESLRPKNVPNRSIPDQAHDNCAQGGNC
jgi:hypothetical protein